MEMNRASLGEIVNGAKISTYFTKRSGVYFYYISIVFLFIISRSGPPRRVFPSYFHCISNLYFISESNSVFLFSFLLLRLLRSPRNRSLLAVPFHWRCRPNLGQGFRCRTYGNLLYRIPRCGRLRRNVGLARSICRWFHPHLGWRYSTRSRRRRLLAIFWSRRTSPLDSLFDPALGLGLGRFLSQGQGLRYSRIRHCHWCKSIGCRTPVHTSS